MLVRLRVSQAMRRRALGRGSSSSRLCPSATPRTSTRVASPMPRAEGTAASSDSSPEHSASAHVTRRREGLSEARMVGGP